MGDDPAQCSLGGCPGATSGDWSVVWTDDVWQVKVPPPSGLPIVLVLEPLEHLDFTDLPDDRAAEMGRLMVSSAAADGGATDCRAGAYSMQMGRWRGPPAPVFLARPTRLPQLRGTYQRWTSSPPPSRSRCATRTPSSSWTGSSRHTVAVVPDPSKSPDLSTEAGRLWFNRILNQRLPVKRNIAQGLLRDERGHVLLCELTYKKDWDLPGGVVDPRESPAACVEREVSEELDLDVVAGELLAVNWLPPGGAGTTPCSSCTTSASWDRRADPAVLTCAAGDRGCALGAPADSAATSRPTPRACSRSRSPTPSTRPTWRTARRSSAERRIPAAGRVPARR